MSSTIRSRFYYVDVLTALLRRGLSLFAYKSGYLDRQYVDRVKKGGIAWRILRYQHVMNPEGSTLPVTYSDFVRPETLDQQLGYLARYCHVISLTELIKLLRSRKPVPERSVVLTFDWGYSDQFVTAFPLLMKHRLKATFFVPTAYIGTNNLIWRDKAALILQLLAEKGAIFPELSLFNADFYQMLDQLSPRREITETAIGLVMQEMERFPPAERLAILTILGDTLDKIGDVQFERCFMDWEEVRKMQEVGMTFGSMGHSGDSFTELSANLLTADLKTSYDILREQNINFTRTVAAPNGLLEEELLAHLTKIKVRELMSAVPGSIIAETPDSLSLLGRQTIFQSLCPSVDTYASTLWGGNFLGIQF